MHFEMVCCTAKKKKTEQDDNIRLFSLECSTLLTVFGMSREILAGLITPASRNLQMLSLSSHFSMTDVGHRPTHSPVEKLQMLYGGILKQDFTLLSIL